MNAVRLLSAWWCDERGQDLVEYTLLIAFLATASVALLLNNLEPTTKVWEKTNDNLIRAKDGTGF